MVKLGEKERDSVRARITKIMKNQTAQWKKADVFSPTPFMKSLVEEHNENYFVLDDDTVIVEGTDENQNTSKSIGGKKWNQVRPLCFDCSDSGNKKFMQLYYKDQDWWLGLMPHENVLLEKLILKQVIQENINPIKHCTIMKENQEEDEKIFKFDRYGLTYDNETINLDNACMKLAGNKHTSVVLFHHRHPYSEE